MLMDRLLQVLTWFCQLTKHRLWVESSLVPPRVQDFNHFNLYVLFNLYQQRHAKSQSRTHYAVHAVHFTFRKLNPRDADSARTDASRAARDLLRDLLLRAIEARR